MITRTEQKCQSKDWKSLLKNGFDRPSDLLEHLALSDHLESNFFSEQLFKMRVPQPFVERMQPGNIDDPLLKQVLPLAQEFAQPNDYSVDPLAEQNQTIPGLLHKYRSRVLLLLSAACAINCRYCFRRHFPYHEHNDDREFSNSIAYIQSDQAINEVIFSGGDPLLVSDEKLQQLTQSIAGIGHIKRIRVHTRLPIVIPQRINSQLLTWCKSSDRLKMIMVLHCNHPNELNEQVAEAIKPLLAAGVSLFNQAVLLKGVNDQADTLAELSEKLFDYNIQPYYLHALDKTQGAHHFAVDDAAATQIYTDLMALLPGFLLPSFVREVVDAKSKIPIAMIDTI